MIRLLILALLLTACTVTIHVDPIGTIPPSPVATALPVDNLGIPYSISPGSDAVNFTFANERYADGEFILDVTTDGAASEGVLTFKAYNADGKTIAGWSTASMPNVGPLRFRLGTSTLADDIAGYVVGVELGE